MSNTSEKEKKRDTLKKNLNEMEFNIKPTIHIYSHFLRKWILATV